MTEATTKIVAYGCKHCPLHDAGAIDWLIALITREKPDLVVDLGDGIEANAASKWEDAKELAISLADEYTAHNAILERIRKASPKANHWYIAGNHDDNINRIGRLDPRVRTLCDWSSLKNQPELQHWRVLRDYNYSRHRGCFSFGPIFFSHGYETTATKQGKEALYFTKNWPFSLYLSAHTHRPTEVRGVCWNDMPLDRWYANVGTMRDMDSALYMDRKAKWNWGQAAAVIETKALKSPRQSKEWDARVEVFRMYDDVRQ